MAFHQPTHLSAQRVVRPPPEERDGAAPRLSVQTEQQPDESQTWVLFSPATEATTASYLTETDRDVETPGRSQLSALGSIETVARSGAQQTSSHPSAAYDDVAIEDDADAELDSLDSHLPEFRSLPGLAVPSHNDSQQAFPILPGHDGLGSFRLNEPALGHDAQEHLYQFEQFNPRRLRRRRESLERVHLEFDSTERQESEKRQWIESWRLEHSRILLEEVQRETRRRRLSHASSRRDSNAAREGRVSVHPRLGSDDTTWHDEEAVEQQVEEEGFLSRITRKVMEDILGIDDRMLSVLLGHEALIEEDELSTTPKASQISAQGVTRQDQDEDTWEVRMLERVSRELGLIVNHLSQHHPGAFSAYNRMQQMPLPYAGLPVIPEAATTLAVEASQPGKQEGQSHSTSTLEFEPTIHRAAQPIQIPGRDTDGVSNSIQEETYKGGNTFTKEEWEQDLDIKLVFRYLRSRFSRSNSTPASSHAHPGVPSAPQDAAARAARVRQHHPLISRSRPAERRVFKATTAPGSPVALRHQSSCASQSTRRSARRSSCSSRHYWDIGGSLGTGSMIASNGPMGSWGEV